MLGRNTQGPSEGNLGIDDMIKAQEERLATLRAQLRECGGDEGDVGVVPVVEGAPIIAHSTGHYPAGVPPTPRTCPREPEPNQSGSVKRNLAQAFVDESVATTHPNPPETVKSSRKSMGHDAQDPNSFLNAPLTPRYTPAKSVDGAPSERPSPKPSQTSQTPSQQKSNEKDALYWKLRRQCVIKASSCSAEALKLYKTKDGRSKLRELMLQNGCDFSLVEVQLQRWSQSTMGQKRSGQWVTKHCLLTTHNWTKKMVEHAWEFAARNQLLRVNEVHGEEEAKLVIEDAFSFDRSENERTVQTMNMSIEDPDGSYLRDAPCSSGSRLDILKHFDEDGGQSPEDKAAVSSGSFRMCFPTITENVSAVAILPKFLEVCGRKLDSAAPVLERLDGLKTQQAREFSKQIQIQVNYMKDVYAKLEHLQGECAVTRTAQPEMQKQILSLCADCTKTDVALNNLVVRSRTLKATKSSKASGSGGASAKAGPKKQVKSQKKA